ncbi:MAG: HAMP domain-containing protein [Candidatus Krumholzibacteriia bacterium]
MHFGRGRRRTVVVDKRFQYDATVIGVVYILAAAFCLSLPIINLMRSMNLVLASQSPDMIAIYHAQHRYTVLALVGFLAGLLTLWIAFSIWRTHRVAGPVVKITHHMHQLAAGDMAGRIRLRAKDELKALAESFNQMAESLEGRERTIRLRIDQGIENARCKLDGSAPAGDALNRLSAEVSQAFEQRCQIPATSHPQAASEDAVTSDAV